VAAPQYLGQRARQVSKGKGMRRIILPATSNTNLNAAVSGTVEDTAQIVTFINEGDSVRGGAIVGMQKTMPSIVTSTTLVNAQQHDVKTFLGRPIIVAEGVWTTLDTANAILYNSNFPETLIANDMYREKLTGFLGLRATMKIRVQVNSQPFQQGRLLLGYIPYGQYIPQKVYDINTTLTGSTGCPHVDLDLSTSTEMILEVPYVSPHLYYNLVTGQGSFGYVFLKVYSPLISPGAEPIGYTVYVYLENVELVVPTGEPIYTGSAPNLIKLSREIKRIKTIDSLKDYVNEQEHMDKCANVFAQMGDEEEPYRKKGILRKWQGEQKYSFKVVHVLKYLD